MKNYPNYLVPLNIAKELKIIGFKSKVYFYYINDKEYRGLYTACKPENFNKNTTISIPVWEQVFDWFREKGLFHSIQVVKDFNEDVKHFEGEIYNNNGDIICIVSLQNTYEETRETLVNNLIEIYKNVYKRG